MSRIDILRLSMPQAAITFAKYVIDRSMQVHNQIINPKQ